MKILVAHNYYQQPGGEDQVFADEVELLRSRGHEVVRFEVHNDSITGRNPVRVVLETVGNRKIAARLRDLVRRERIDVVHFHNTFPLISPAAYHAAGEAGAAVIQTLHNFRLVCPAAVLLRDGRVCESCVGKTVAWPAVLHGCYRQSRAASATVAAMLTTHRLANTWRDAVDRYIVLTHFAREKFIDGGLPAEKIAVKSNFVSPDPGPGSGTGGYALFVGRLSREKGIATLLEVWRKHSPRLPLKIAGDGPLAELVTEAAAADPRIEWLGQCDAAHVRRLMGDATMLVVPSVWYEGMPLTILESLARGTPLVASRLGAMAELVVDGQTGLHFTPGDAADLARKVALLDSDPERRVAMRQAARETYFAQFTADRCYAQLMEIYRGAIRLRHDGSDTVAPTPEVVR